MSTSAKDKAKFAVFTMLLFRPRRKPVAEMKLACNLDARRDDVDAPYACIWAEYERWFKDDIEAVAMPYITKAISIRALGQRTRMQISRGGHV